MLDDGDGLNESLDISGYRFGLITPTGAEIFGNMLAWRSGQLATKANVQLFPNGRMCANNVSKVYTWSSVSDTGAKLAPLSQYSAQGVRNLITNVSSEGGAKLYALPKTPQGIVDTLNAIYEGHIPAGAVVAGCATEQCDSDPGNQHVALMGEETLDQSGTFDTDARDFLPPLPKAGSWANSGLWMSKLRPYLRSATNGTRTNATATTSTWWLYHNNWLRPENVGLPNDTSTRPKLAGNPKSYMVARELLRSAHPRQWMATPWLRVTRNAAGKIVSTSSLLPALDDLDPRQYHMVIAVPKELANEIAQGKTGHRVVQSGAERSVLPDY